MVFMFVIEGLVLLVVGGLILSVARKMWKKADVEEKVQHLKLVDEQYETVTKANEEFKDSDTKEQEIKKFKGE